MGKIILNREGNIATVTLSNPEKLNALDVAMWNSITKTFNALSKDKSIRAIIINGENENFAAGANIEEFQKVRKNAKEGIKYHSQIITPALRAITKCIHPTIAAIEGVCVGGGLEIACSCDIRFATPDSRFGIPIKRLGFALAPDEMQGLVQLIGLANTLEILLEGHILNAQEAKEKGILNRIAQDVQKEAWICAKRIAEGAPLAARTNKWLARYFANTNKPLTKKELRKAYAPLDSKDYQEGVRSFLAKEKHEFLGK